MRSIRHYSISRKLTLMNMLVSGVALLLACSAFFAYDFYTFRTTIADNQSTTGRILGSNTAAALLFNDSQAAGNSLSALAASPHTLSAQIYTPTADSSPPIGVTLAPRIAICPPFRLGEKQIRRFESDEIDLISPIIFGKKLIGFVYLRSDLKAMTERLRNYALITLAVLLASLIAALLISRVSQRAISTPVVHLAETARTISREKDYSIRFPLAVNRDELSVLVEAFNEMLAQIQERDIALLKAHDELELRVQERTTELAAANRAKSTFLSTMSHEIRTPLNAMLGYAQLMLRDPAMSPEAKANLQIMGRSGEHLLSLINAVLDMSKIEAGRIEITPVTFSLSRMLADLAAMFRLRAEAKGLRFEMVIDGEIVPNVIADEGKVRQALINLLGNAIKFTTCGHVKLHVSLRENTARSLWLSASVEDTGVGIAPEDQKKLFQPFIQAKGTMSVHEGTGLGLSLSREFARLMGGDVTVTSHPGAGSIFKFEIPVERGDAGSAVERISPRRVQRLRSGTNVPRILVVDDHIENQSWLMKLLAAIGFSVRGADNGLTAIEHWAEWQPHAILMDIQMPVMDGLEATRRIKADPRSKATIIIGLTASALEDDRRDVLESGADAFLTKPCREDELLERLRILLNIEFEYDEDGPAADPLALPSGALARLPRGLAEELRNATLDGNKRRLDKLILQVRESEAADTANALQAFANKYEYDALARLLDEACCG